VLIDYSAADGRRALSVFKVEREKIVPNGATNDPADDITFDYPAIAGTQLQSPMPLPLLPLPLETEGTSHNTEVIDAASDDPDAGNGTSGRSADYDRFTFEDRKGVKWIYRGPHSTNPDGRLLMRYFYLTQPSFAFPDAAGANQSPPTGSVQPYLRTFQGGVYTSVPEIISYTPQWPAEVPVLEFGETLTNARVGLPDVRNNTSLEVLYEQSRANDPTGNRESVVLFDATRVKTYLLGTTISRVPPSIATDSRNGRTYFQNLPPTSRSAFISTRSSAPRARSPSRASSWMKSWARIICCSMCSVSRTAPPSSIWCP
jgi:hypothetical protein